MKNNYTSYSEITREVLDGIKVGNKVKFNDFKKPMKVVGVSENYFLMVVNMFGETRYSVCEKKPSTYTRNNFTKGNFRVGPDNYVFGGCIDFEDEQEVCEYLSDFESGKIELSVRRAVNLVNISIKKSA